DALIAKDGSQALRPSVKMSKSLGNVVNPDDVIREFGADTMRLYIMFIGDFEKTATWSDEAVKGCKRFLDRVWNLQDMAADSLDYYEAHIAEIHKTIKKVSDDIEAMKFNTAIAAMMALVNKFYADGLTKGDLKTLLLLLSPIAPHLCEEMWENLGFAGEGMICHQRWPEYDESKTVAAQVQLAVQVGGKMRGTILAPTVAVEDEVVAIALADPKIAKHTDGKELIKVILVKNRLVNLIVKPKS
ncbi:MAG: class I tRNA ligase family protein, partial [Oscillospiraceae bacterium]|nr:class I tRNA ligase family protein [Oscillospiraceae bacterium]